VDRQQLVLHPSHLKLRRTVTKVTDLSFFLNPFPDEEPEEIQPEQIFVNRSSDHVEPGPEKSIEEIPLVRAQI